MAKFQTSLCHMLDIDVPIIQAPMGRATNPAFAAAISNSGAIGMLGMHLRDTDAVRQLTRETRQLTGRCFGANFILRPEIPQELIEEQVDGCLEEGATFISFFWDDPSRYIERVHSAGALVMYTVGSAAEARRAVDSGVDIIAAQGWEAGGHVRGEVATFPLVPNVVNAVAPIPVVVAGGIADGRGMAAALVLGAAGVWMGTRFLASEEAGVHPSFKDMILQALDTDTVHTTLFDGIWPDAPHRALRNSTYERWEEAGRPPKGERPGEGDVLGHWADGRPVVRYAGFPYAGISGDIEAMALYSGQSACLVDRIQPAAEIVRQVANEAAQVLKGCVSLVMTD